MYFLKTRYYDPTVGRFVSTDDVAYIDPETIGGTNLFAYCNNNPVMNSDPSGHFAISSLVVGLIIGAIVGGAVGGITAHNNGGSVFKGITLGAGIGALFGAGLGLSFGLVGGGVAGLFGGAFTFSNAASILAGATIGFGTISNLVNAIYYTYYAEPIKLNEKRVVNGRTASYYVTDDGGYRHISRWDRLNHVKAMTEESWYNFNALNYYSEYDAHMYGWKFNADFGLFSDYKGNLMRADVFSNIIDTGLVVIPTILLAILGL